MGQGVIDRTRSSSPWVGMARDEAKEWWRDHPGASFSEFAEWVDGHYEPQVFTAGFGWHPRRSLGRRMTAIEQEVLDDVHVGLHEAVELELARRRARHRRDEAA